MDKLAVAGRALESSGIKVVEIVELAQGIEHDTSLAPAICCRERRLRNDSWEIYPEARAIAR